MFGIAAISASRRYFNTTGPCDPCAAGPLGLDEHEECRRRLFKCLRIGSCSIGDSRTQRDYSMIVGIKVAFKRKNLLTDYLRHVSHVSGIIRQAGIDAHSGKLNDFPWAAAKAAMLSRLGKFGSFGLLVALFIA